MAEGWTVPGFTPVRDLGAGASGRLVLAVDDLTKTQVTIRYLAASLPRDDAFRQRLSWLSQLEDDNLVQVYELVEDGGEAAVVGEFVEGVPLRRLLIGPIEPEAAVVLLSDCLLGLAAAHAKGVVHGHCTPDQTLVTPAGKVKLTDLGLAVSTGRGFPTGDPGYLAPERWQGAEQSPAADLYAATVLFYECLIGHRPFNGTAKAHQNLAIPVENVPGPLRSLVLHGLAKDPARRPDSAGDFLVELDEAVAPVYGADWEKRGRQKITELVENAGNAPARPSGPPKRTGPPVRSSSKSKRPLLLLGALVTVLAAGGIFYVLNDGHTSDEGPAPTASVPTAALPPSTPPPTTAPATRELTATDLATRLAASANTSAAVSFRLASSRQVTSAQGLVKAGDFQLSTALTPRAGKQQFLLYGQTVYWTVGARTVKAKIGTAGLGTVAAQARWGASMPSLLDLLKTSDRFARKAGQTYTGSTTDAGDLTGVAAGYRKAKVAYELTLSPGGRVPTRLKLVLTAPGKTTITMTTAFTRWGNKFSPKAPR
ncbi:MAG: serine/threonine-protein kinase [Streptosporangiaceae bacterium]